jgi:methylase of polypeptide subunit release factors
LDLPFLLPYIRCTAGQSAKIVSKSGRRIPAETPPELARDDQIPIGIGSSEEFARLRDLLGVVGFNQRAVAATLKISDMSQIPQADPEGMEGSSASPALLAVIDLLVLGNVMPLDGLRARCGEAAVAAFAALDLIHDARLYAPFATLDLMRDSVICPVSIYPIGGLFIASDRRTFLGGRHCQVTVDIVFPAYDSGTLQLLRLLPAAEGGEALDLCSGSGIGALHLARKGVRATTVDITERSAYFTAFNAKLNGIQIEILRDDLYEPVAGRRFDVICAHPPWVPSTGDAMVFRDGGDTGEEIVQRVFAGIPHHLRQGGTAIVVSLGRDGRDARYEQRVRRWLGVAGDECDVILGVDKMLSVDDMVASMRRLHFNDDDEKAERMVARFRALGTQQFVYGAVFIRRTGAVVAEPPLRLRMRRTATAGDFERIFAWRWRRRRWQFQDWLAAARPRLCPQLESHCHSVVRNGVMVPISAMLSARAPLSATVQPDVWIARLLERLEGTQTVAQTFEAAQRDGQMPADFTLVAFVDLIGKMIERGLLDVDMPAL